MKKKIIVVSVFLLLMSCLICGCDALKPLKRSEAKTYIEDELGLTNYKLSWFSKETEKSSHTWVVYDKDNDVEFYVYSGVGFDGDYIIDAYRVIIDDYSEKYARKKAEELPKKITYMEPGTDKRFGDKYGYYLISYANLDELNEECNAFWPFAEDVREKFGTPVMFRFKLDIPHDPEIDKMYYMPFDYTIGDFYGQVKNGDIKELKSINSKEELYEEVKLCYFSYGYTYRLPEIMSQMSDSDVNKTLKNNDLKRIYIVDDDGTIRKCDDVIAYVKGYSVYRVSYGSFYEILIKEGFNVIGPQDHYTYTSDNGDVYEFSYDFWKDGDHYGSYYLKNGTEVKCGDKIKNTLTHEEIKEICGLYVDFSDYPYMDRYDKLGD